MRECSCDLFFLKGIFSSRRDAFNSSRGVATERSQRDMCEHIQSMNDLTETRAERGNAYGIHNRFSSRK